MAHNVNFRYFDVKIDKDKVKEEIVDLLLSLKPGWTKDDLCHQEYTDGYINSMICFYQKTDEKRDDALVVRVYGFEGKDLPLERENEFLTMQVAHATDCFPALVGSFINGVIYEYEPGRIVTFHDLVKPEVVKKVAYQLYHFHHIDPDSMELYDRKGEPCKYNKIPKTFEITLQMIKGIPSSTKNERFKEKFENFRKELTDEYLMREYEFVKNIHDDVKLPIALSHADFHPRNMIINDETGKLTFIDYEMTSYTYEAADLVRFFDNKEFYDKHGLCQPDEPDITDEVRLMYLREYFNAKHEEEGRVDAVVSPDEMEKLDTEMRIVKISNLMTFMVVALLYADISLKDIHLLDSLGRFKEQYEIMKNDLPSLRDRYLKLVAQKVWKD